MRIFIDSHVHFYPCYEAWQTHHAFRVNTWRHGADFGVMMLAQRDGIDVADLRERLAKGPTHSSYSFNGKQIDLPTFETIPGRQIACYERVEVLALGTDARIKDGCSAANAVRQALDVGALPVLAWGVGKWMLGREKVVEELLAKYKPSELLIGDSTMRPVFWPEPRLMRQARNAGYRVIRGSDPLPPRSEQTRAGQYGDVADTADFDPSAPAAPQILRILRDFPLAPAGRRAGVAEFALRMAGI